MGFSFKLENNLDEKVYYNLFFVSPYGPLPIMGGELEAKESNGSEIGWGEGHYYIIWSGFGFDWSSRKDMEIDDSVGETSVVEISLNYVPIEVFIER